MSASMERMTLRLGGAAAIVGSLLGMVGNLIHPVTPIGDPEGVARVIAESDTWVPIHLAIVLGIVLMLGGLVGLRHAIREGTAGVFARYGLVAAIAGATIGLILVILDGVAARQLAQEWAVAPAGEREVALALVRANETINFALASLFNLVFAAVTFILFGIAVLLSGRFARWLGWPPLIAGVISIAAGTIQASVGEPTDASRWLTIVGPTVITFWLLIIGVEMVRGGRSDGDPSSRTRNERATARPDTTAVRAGR